MNKRIASAPFILATVALDALSLGLVLPILPTLVTQVAHATPSRASLYVGTLFAMFSLMQFLFAPLVGGLSDRFGRRPVLLVSLLAMGINSLLWVWVHDLFWLFMMRILAGIFTANISTASAYLADVTPPEQRARTFGLLGAMFGFGFVIGPTVGGLLGNIWIRLPFLVSAGLIFINVLYGYFVLPESLPVARRRRLDWRRANPLGSLVNVALVAETRRLVFAWFCTWLAFGATQSSFILANQMRFGWDSARIGLVLGAGGVCQVVIQAFLTRKMIAWIGPRGTALAGYGFSSCGFLIYALASHPWILYAGIPVIALGALAGPPIQSMLSARAGPQRQGEIQGGLSSVQGLALVIGPILMGSLFAATTQTGHTLHFPGAPFLLASLISLTALVTLLAYRDVMATAPQPAMKQAEV